MERNDYQNALGWPERDLKDTAAHLAAQLRNVELYPRGSERREQIAKHMSVVAFEEYSRYNERPVDDVRAAGWHNYDGTAQEAPGARQPAETPEYPA